MNPMELYCLGLHFKCLYEQGINERPFDPAEPCHICKYNKTCRMETWNTMPVSLEEETGIVVNFIVDHF